MGIFLTRDGKNSVVDLTSSNKAIFDSFNSILEESIRRSVHLKGTIESNIEDIDKLPVYSLESIDLKIPLIPYEVWGSGVTYVRSKEAREVETSLKGLYTQVYNAERPEIFFKTTGLRCVGPGDLIGIRSDSKWTVPEPELAVVLGANCDVVGYTIGNDVSARDIEGVNPLYLPQAKIFANCCAIGPVVVTPEEIRDVRSLKVDLTIYRNESPVYRGSVSTSSLKRRMDDLLSYLKRDNIIPEGSVFMTGTGVVPPDDFSLKDGDLVEIEIEGIGKLRNRAKRLSSVDVVDHVSRVRVKQKSISR
jgi:2-dehydro-3-deoxy-D-arabinonate dehydratase